MLEPYSFRAVIESADNGGAFIAIPFDVEEAFGRKRVKVVAAINGQPFRLSLVRMGTPCHIMGIRRAIRDLLGVAVGDEVEVSLIEDTEPRLAELPDDFRAALTDNPAAGAFFDSISYTHQREYILWIDDAKQDTTRQRRIAKAIDLLAAGRKTRD